MGEIIDLRNRRVRALVSYGLRLMDEEELTPEQLKKSLRRYILIHYGGSVNTVYGYVEECMLKIEYERERQARIKLV